MVVAIYRLYSSPWDVELCVKDIGTYSYLKAKISGFSLYWAIIYGQKYHDHLKFKDRSDAIYWPPSLLKKY